MDHNDTKYILKKLMQDALAEEERAALSDRKAVKQQMLGQWENAPDAVSSDRVDGRQIWYQICQRLWNKASDRRYLYYKIYSIAASLLLLLAVGSMAYLVGSKEEVPVYIVTSGIQNMQSVSLPDGTVVQLGPGSKLTYPAVFTGETREIYLNGQAFFDVYKNPAKSFIVHTSNMRVEALGTAFEIFDYEIENKSETVLLNGMVKIGLNRSEGDTEEFVLSPNEKIVHDKRTDSTCISGVDADKYTAWRKQKILSFENEKLSMIIPRLEQWYGRKVMCQQDLADKYRFTFKVRDESLERILFIMGESSPLGYQKTTNGNFIIKLK
ncbi:FecR family protein [uncultured Parabacteroides sp.]|uniref:FecR family protein n=1 Tax=uncultured Parabacteroides sp. TaxID=512312 RepID=UPI0025F64B08|nr:FecR family protein [uncultured Parabacteroides sp.]